MSLIVISDLAYAEIYFGDTPTPSILQVEGAKDVAVEFTSMSQDLFDGRLADRLRGRQRAADRGADAGEILSRLWRLHADPGGRRAPRSTARRTSSRSIATLYRKRRDVLVESFGRAGWDIPSPASVDVRLGADPERFHNLGSMEFSKQLLTEAQVAVAPGVGFGEEGEGFRPHRAGRE